MTTETTFLPRRPVTRTGLFSYLDALGIAYRTIDHPAVHTVAESSTIDLDLPGAHTKNLFLKDDRGALLLIVAKSSTRVDLKRVSKTLPAGRLSFGKPELLQETLGVTPGSVTAFAVINDVARRVRVIIDAELTAHDSVNCHPMENVATTNIALADLLRFIRATGHEPDIMAVSAA